MSTFTRILLGLLAIFYVSVFAIEATHGHDNLVEITDSSDSDRGSDTGQCHICAYFGHHEIKEIAVADIPLFALIDFQDCPFGSFEPTRAYQTYLKDFINRGPPCDLV